jgi:Spy/CpxP family protein refolding chaperone
MRICKRICSITALAVTALALSCSPLLAQGDPQGPPPPPDQAAGPDGGGPGPGMRMNGGGGMDGRMGPDGRRGPDGSGPGDRGEWMRGREEFRGRDGDFGGGGRMRGRGFGGGDFMLGRLLRDSDLRKQVGISDDQVAKIRQQESEFRKAEIRDRADLEVKRLDLKDLLESDNPDRAAIDSKLQEISASQMALEKAAIDHRLDMRDAITPAQREKIRQIMKDRWQRGGPGGQGPAGAGRREPNAQMQGRRQNGAGNSVGNGAGNGVPPPPPNNQ